MNTWIKVVGSLVLPLFVGAALMHSSTRAADQTLRHVVLFKFKDTSSQSDVDMVCQAFANLRNEIPEIKDFEWGENNSPENLNQGLTHAFVLTFHSEDDRDTYLVHPAHKAFGQK